MTSIQLRILAPPPVDLRPVPPQLRDVVARVAMSLATAVVVPTAFFAATLMIFNITTAVLVALAWMAGAMCWRWTAKRPVSGLLLLALGIMTVKTGVTLATGNTFIYFVQPVFVDLVVATVFLGSLWSARPIVARLAPDFYPMERSGRREPGGPETVPTTHPVVGPRHPGEGNRHLLAAVVPVDDRLRPDQGWRDHRPDPDRGCRDRRVVGHRGPPGRPAPARLRRSLAEANRPNRRSGGVSWPAARGRRAGRPTSGPARRSRPRRSPPASWPHVRPRRRRRPPTPGSGRAPCPTRRCRAAPAR